MSLDSIPMETGNLIWIAIDWTKNMDHFWAPTTGSRVEYSQSLANCQGLTQCASTQLPHRDQHELSWAWRISSLLAPVWGCNKAKLAISLHLSVLHKENWPSGQWWCLIVLTQILPKILNFSPSRKSSSTGNFFFIYLVWNFSKAQ